MSSTTDSRTPQATGAQPAADMATTSPVPRLGEGFQDAATKTGSESVGESEDDANQGNEKSSLKNLFRFGKKKDDKVKGKNKAALELHGQDTTSSRGRPNVGGGSPQLPAVSSPPPQSTHSYQSQASPTRKLHSSSSRVVSPAGSQIFERNVQESSLPMPSSPAIPSHIQREDHIPSVLDASSEAITNKSLDPDSVEIVMRTAHQPAGASVASLGHNDSMASSYIEDFGVHPDKEDAIPIYASTGSSDVRRLSFISFADVVQSEHADYSGRDNSTHSVGLTSLPSEHQSPSPVRSPGSSQGFEISPPTSKSASIKGHEVSPTRGSRPMGSPTPSIPSIANQSVGELTIETMSQALRKSGSGDLGGTRSQPKSPTLSEAFSERSLR